MDDAGSDREPAPVTDKLETSRTEKEQSTGDSIFEGYQPTISTKGAKSHPADLVESAAMAAVKLPSITYRPNIPFETVKSGKLSDVQLEAITAAGQAHQDTLPNGYQRGFFIGDGTGVGKGREIAGILWDNWNQGRKKSIWVSKDRTLAKDAKRDMKGIGWNDKHLMEQGSVKAGDAIPKRDGVLYTAYSTLASAAKTGQLSRLQAIIDWAGPDFDGVIAFDESHKMGNAISIKEGRYTKKPSQMALAALDLQKALPKAKVVYVSATGATEVSNLAYAERLGLWGEDTAFPNVTAFIGRVSMGGIAAMEVVARDMKAMGSYLARKLAYNGKNAAYQVKYRRLEHALSGQQREVYDELAGAWQTVLANIDEALAITEADSNGRSHALSAFWGSHQRFFNQVLTAMQMPSVISSIKQDVKDGKAVVLQITNTDEASTNRALANAESLEDVDITPRDQLMQMIENSFPVQQYEQYEDEDGNVRSRPVVDSNGNPVVNREAVAKREALLDKLGSIRVPDAPLDQILNVFGIENVAEVTGRSKRVVTSDDGTGPKKIRQGWSKMKGVADAAQFMADKKQILIFSEAGGTGASYHADLAAVNQRQRSHYILQAGWRADSAVQGLGRSHRSNQAVAPEYVLVTTDLKGHKRFISSIARKLSQLGALTEGERSASSQGLFSERDNLESEYAADAVEQLIHRVHRGQIPGIDMDTLVRELGLPKLVDEHGQLNATQVPTVPRFLNRILSMKIDMQNKVFDIFSALMDANVSKAEENGTLDTGLETLKAKKIKVVDTQAVYTDSRSGAVTEYVQLDVDYPVNKVPYDPRFKIVVNNQSGRPWQSAGNKTTTKEETGEIIEVVTLRNGRGNIRNVPKEDFAEKFTEIDGQPEARAAWDAALKDIPDTVTQREHLITGALLPIWDKLKGHPRIVRVQTGKETMLGRIIPGENISEVMALLDVEGKAVDMVPEDVQRAVLENGQTVTFDNGWKIKRKMVAGERRMEVEGMQYSDYNVLNGYGTFAERINYITRVFIPTGAAGNEVIEKITRSRKILTVTGNAVTSQNQNANLDPDSDEATKVQAGVEGKTVVDVAGFIAKNAPDKATRLIAEKVKQAIEAQAKSGMNFSFKVAHLGDMVPRSLVNARGASITSLDGSNNVEVWVNGADITGKVGVSYETVLHEIIHAATQGAIHLGNMTRFSGTDIANSVSDLYAVTNQIVRHFNNRVAQSKRGEATLTDFEKKIFDSSVNALGSPNEIISWAMTNKDMQDYLDTIKLGRTRTLWSKFVQAVRNMLGLDTSSDTALSEVLRIGEELLLSQPMELFAELQTGKQPTQVQTTAYQIASQQVSKATKPLTASFVKGTPHTGLYKNAPAMAQLSTGAILTLTREPGNVHDKNAVKIMLGTQAVGYVDKKINAKIAARMDAGENLQARVSKVTGRSVAPRFTVLIGTQADLAAKPATGTGTAPKGPGKPPTTPRPPSPRRHGQAAIDKLLLDVLGADKMSIMQDIRKNGLTPENEQAVLTKEITPVKETGAAKELWLAQFRAAPKAIARKSLSLLTLRQLRDIYRKVAPVEKFYQATRETAADTTKLMGEADKVYEKWSKLETKDADAMSMIMSEATVASVSPDIPFESRLDIKEAIEKMEKSADTLTGLQGSMEDVDDKVKWHEDRVIRLAGEIEAEKKRFSEHKRLAAKYDALPKEAKEVYQEVRKMYDANLGRVRDGLISRLERSTMSDASKKMAMDSIRLKFEQYLRNGPYFPLSRFGEYIVQITDDAGNREVHFFDFIGQRDRAVARWQAETTAAGAPRWTIKQKTSKDYSPEADGASSQFVSDMAKVIDNSTISSGEKSGLIDELNQLFIRSMPDMSHRKHFSHRKKVEGYSRDQIRAFASNMQHAAHHIARIRHADKMTSALSELNEIVRTSEGNADLTHVTDLFNELNKRHQILLNPKISPIAQALTSFGFIWNIGPSIASAMVNMSQTPLVAFPMMGARFNDGRGAFMALRRASAQYFGSPFVGSKGFDMSKNTKVGANARAMLAALEDDGTIDTSMALSLAQATSADLLNLAQTKNGGQMLKVMRVVSYPFHVTEVANRQITAVAAYELAVKHGATHEEAISQAREVVLDSHFDYSQANRARFMEGNVQRVLFLFKQYSQQMSYLLGRSFHQAVKGESQAVKNQARNQLMGIIGGHFLVSGAFGMPVIGGIAEVLEFFVNALGDDDEPWDWESALRNMLADTVGKTAGESIAHGPWRALPVLGDLDIASRVSLGDLWFRTPDRELEGKDAWNQYINMALGPLASNGASMAQGLSAMSEGEVARGVEMMLPKAIKDAMKTIRYAREGVTSWNDATLIDELNTVEMFGQVLGFSPARLNEMYEGKNAIKNLEAKLDDRKQQLVNGWIEATRAGDIDTANRYMKDMVQFTRKNPAFAITRQGLAQSVRMRAKVQAQTKNGVYMPAKREEMLKEGRFANI